jgi:hypothetical protein
MVTKLTSVSSATLLTTLLLALGVAQATGASQARCPNEASPGFRVYLPECRAYELVTPPYKEAMEVSSVEGVSQDGSFLVIRSLGSFAGIESTPLLGGIYAVNRTSVGWQTSPLEAPVTATYPRFEWNGTSADLARSLWDPASPDSAGEAIFLREGKALIRVGPGGPPGGREPKLIFVGASGDLSHLVFGDRAPVSGENDVHLWLGDSTRGEGQLSLYEYIGTGDSEPQLVGISNEGLVGTLGEAHLISQCGTEFGSPERDVYNAISRSGSTVFFTALGRDAGRPCQAPSVEVAPAVSELYARIDNGQSTAHTVAISEPESKDCEACILSGVADAQFRGASSDGSQVFFTTMQQLLHGATGEGPYLYEYDFEAPEKKKVTLVSAGDAKGARVQGVARVSEDGSHIYFVGQGVLTSKETNAYGEEAKEGAENLYVFTQECPGGGASCPEPQQRLSFVARLSRADREDWAGSDLRPVQATPDGRFLVFESAADLTPDEEERTEAGQVFEFDAQTGALVRVSRGADGYNEDGNSSEYPATVPEPEYVRTDYPNSRLAALSADGSHVFFTSSDGLTPGAVIGHSSVYEYHAGEVSLISNGHDLSESGARLLGTDGSGEDVFFTTSNQLVPQDVDTQVDIYDARIAGGFAATPATPGCSEDACQGPLGGVLQSLGHPTLSSVGEGAVPTTSSAPAKVKAAPKRTKMKNKKTPRKKPKRRPKRAARRTG